MGGGGGRGCDRCWGDEELEKLARNLCAVAARRGTRREAMEACGLLARIIAASAGFRLCLEGALHLGRRLRVCGIGLGLLLLAWWLAVGAQLGFAGRLDFVLGNARNARERREFCSSFVADLVELACAPRALHRAQRQTGPIPRASAPALALEGEGREEEEEDGAPAPSPRISVASRWRFSLRWKCGCLPIPEIHPHFLLAMPPQSDFGT